VIYYLLQYQISDIDARGDGVSTNSASTILRVDIIGDAGFVVVVVVVQRLS
jgi:hypothetical protein